MIRFFAGIIVGAVIMYSVLCLIRAYRELNEISKQLQEKNQDLANDGYCDNAERKETQ